jgi:hypothetical protein
VDGKRGHRFFATRLHCHFRILRHFLLAGSCLKNLRQVQTDSFDTDQVPVAAFVAIFFYEEARRQ